MTILRSVSQIQNQEQNEIFLQSIIKALQKKGTASKVFKKLIQVDSNSREGENIIPCSFNF